MKIKIKNKVSEIIKDRGFVNPKPTDKVLQHLGMTARRFQKMLRNEGSEITMSEVRALSKWLNVDIDELFVDQVQQKTAAN